MNKNTKVIHVIEKSSSSDAASTQASSDDELPVGDLDDAIFSQFQTGGAKATSTAQLKKSNSNAESTQASEDSAVDFQNEGATVVPQMISKWRERYWCLCAFCLSNLMVLHWGFVWAASPDIMTELGARNLSALPSALMFGGLVFGSVLNVFLSRHLQPRSKRILIYVGYLFCYGCAFSYRFGIALFLAAMFIGQVSGSIAYIHGSELLKRFPNSVFGWWMVGYGTATFTGNFGWTFCRDVLSIQGTLAVLGVASVVGVVLLFEVLVSQSKKYWAQLPLRMVDDLVAIESIGILDVLRSSSGPSVIKLTCLACLNAVPYVLWPSFALVVQTYCSYSIDSYLGFANQDGGAMRALGLACSAYGLGLPVGRKLVIAKNLSNAVRSSFIVLQLAIISWMGIDSQFDYPFLSSARTMGYWMLILFSTISGMLHGYVDSSCLYDFFHSNQISSLHSEIAFSFQYGLFGVVAVISSILVTFLLDANFSFDTLYPATCAVVT